MAEDLLEDITKVLYGTTEMNVVKVINGSDIYYPFVKAFTYTTGSKTGVSSITCTRASSPYKGASTGTVSNGGTIYYGDTFYISCSSATGYTASSSLSSSKTATVTANVTGADYTSATINTYTVSSSATNVTINLYTDSSHSTAFTSGNKVNHGTTIYYRITPNTGYSYNSKTTYTDGSKQITSNTTISASGTRLTWSFTVTLSDYVTKYKVSTDNSSWTEYSATKTFSSIDYATTYYVKPSAYSSSGDQYTYTWSSGSTSTSTLTYSSHSNITYKMTRSTNSYAVTFTAGSYVQNAFTSTSSSATSGNASGTKYSYGATVYYFVTKNADTDQYTYTCSGTQVSGNVYRLGSITVGTSNALGTLSSTTRTTNQYAITFTAGTYCQNAFVSTSSTATSGSASGTKYDYGTTVYYFITKNANTAQYTYTSTGTNVSGNVYRLGSTTIGTSNALGTIGSVTRTVNQYTVSITKGTGISTIYYKYGDSSSSYTSSTSNVSFSVDYNTEVWWYATASTGYSYSTYTSSNPCNPTITAAYSHTPTATRLTYSFTVTLSDYVTAFQYSTDNSTWTTSSATKTFSSVDYATTYYIKPSSYGTTGAQYTYTWSSGSASTSTLTYSSHSNITYKQTRTTNSYAVTFTTGNYVKSVYTSTSSTATSGNASGTKYNYGSTVYIFATLADNTSSYTYSAPSTWSLVSGRTYRVSSKSISAAYNFGTISANRTSNSVTYTINIAFSTSPMVDPYYVCEDSNEYNNMMDAIEDSVVYVDSISKTYTSTPSSITLTEDELDAIVSNVTSYDYYGGNVTVSISSGTTEYYVAVYVEH